MCSSWASASLPNCCICSRAPSGTGCSGRAGWSQVERDQTPLRKFQPVKGADVKRPGPDGRAEDAAPEEGPAGGAEDAAPEEGPAPAEGPVPDADEEGPGAGPVPDEERPVPDEEVPEAMDPAPSGELAPTKGRSRGCKEKKDLTPNGELGLQ